MANSTSPKDFIEARGGAHEMARAMRMDPRTVRMWKVRNRLPRKAWPEILEFFPDVTIDELRAVEARGD